MWYSRYRDSVTHHHSLCNVSMQIDQKETGNEGQMIRLNLI